MATVNTRAWPRDGAVALLRDQMTYRRLRIGAGLVLFTFLSLHLAMHALGNVSYETMKAATALHDAVWRTLPGAVLLYGAFAIHFTLAFWALYARRSFRMGSDEMLRLVLGFSIFPLIVAHWAGVRWVDWMFGVDRKYDAVLYAYFHTNLWWGWRQLTVLVVAWTHGCLGIHIWLRHRPGYARYAPALLAFAVLLPIVSMLGILQGTRAVIAEHATAAQPASSGYDDPYAVAPAAANGTTAADDPYAVSPGPSTGSSATADPYAVPAGPSAQAKVDPNDPYAVPPGNAKATTADGATITRATSDLVDELLWAYVLLLAAVIAARGARWVAERGRGTIVITYPGERTVRVPRGFPVLEASRLARIPHASICGGRGRCTTCRIRVLRGFEGLPAPLPAEEAALRRIGAGPQVRLACQTRPETDVTVLPLLPPDITAGDPRRREDAGSASTERIAAILFVDIRRSTALFERRLPYDVVFLLNHFFDAVAGAVHDAGGAPNQFIGDGLMAIFGMRTDAATACRQALAAAKAIEERVATMNTTLAPELREPIAIGVGIHAGNVILGEIGYHARSIVTAIGDTVHVASRLQDLTKEFHCRVIVSETVAEIAGIDLSHLPEHEVQVRGREAPLLIRVATTAAELDMRGDRRVETPTTLVHDETRTP